MDEEQRQKLEDFKDALSDELKGYLSDRDSLRFIRARKWQVDKAAEMAVDWWDWFNKPAVEVSGREGRSPRDILNPVEDANEAIYIRLMPHSNYGIGKEGHPVYWEQTGLISSRMGEINKLLSVEDMVTRHVRQQEIAIARINHFAAALNKPIDSQIIVMNLANLSYKVDTKALTTFKQTLIIDQNYYPERLHVLFMINAPWFFTAIWSMIKPWIDPVTADKMQIVGSNYLPKLREFIDDDQIPSEFGGSNEDFPWQWPNNNGDFLESINYRPMCIVDGAAEATFNSNASPRLTIDVATPQSPASVPYFISLRSPVPTIHSINLRLLHCRMHKVEEVGKEYHTYKMTIRYADLQSWLVHCGIYLLFLVSKLIPILFHKVSRRYSEFRKFRRLLKLTCANDGHVQWPKLPPKSFFRSSNTILSERFLGLELFVSAVIAKISKAYLHAHSPPDVQERISINGTILPVKNVVSKDSAIKLKVLLLEFLDAHSSIDSLVAASRGNSTASTAISSSAISENGPRNPLDISATRVQTEPSGLRGNPLSGEHGVDNSRQHQSINMWLILLFLLFILAGICVAVVQTSGAPMRVIGILGGWSEALNVIKQKALPEIG